MREKKPAHLAMQRQGATLATAQGGKTAVATGLHGGGSARGRSHLLAEPVGLIRVEVRLAHVEPDPEDEARDDQEGKEVHGLLLRHGRLKLRNTAQPRPRLLQLNAGRFGRLAYPPAQKVTGLSPRVEVAEARTKAGALNHPCLAHHFKRSHLALKLRHINPHMRGARHPSLYRLDAVAKGQIDTHGLLLRCLFRLLLYGRRGEIREATARNGGNDSVLNARREVVGPLVNRLIRDANCFGSGGHGPPKQFNGFGFKHRHH